MTEQKAERSAPVQVSRPRKNGAVWLHLSCELTDYERQTIVAAVHAFGYLLPFTIGVMAATDFADLIERHNSSKRGLETARVLRQIGESHAKIDN